MNFKELTEKKLGRKIQQRGPARKNTNKLKFKYFLRGIFSIFLKTLTQNKTTLFIKIRWFYLLHNNLPLILITKQPHSENKIKNIKTPKKEFSFINQKPKGRVLYV
jgi:hypothetical protein